MNKNLIDINIPSLDDVNYATSLNEVFNNINNAYIDNQCGGNSTLLHVRLSNNITFAPSSPRVPTYLLYFQVTCPFTCPNPILQRIQECPDTECPNAAPPTSKQSEQCLASVQVASIQLCDALIFSV